MFEMEHKIDKMFVTEKTRNKWKKALPYMGVVPDKKVARKIGVTASAVCNVRGALGIMPMNFPKQCEKYGVEINKEVSNA